MGNWFAKWCSVGQRNKARTTFVTFTSCANQYSLVLHTPPLLLLSWALIGTGRCVLCVYHGSENSRVYPICSPVLAVPLSKQAILDIVKIYRSSVVAAAEYRICLSKGTIEPIFIGYKQCCTHFRIFIYLSCILICYDICICIRYIVTFF